MKIVERKYSSTTDFVTENGLEETAEMLFGEGWENEDDVHQIEELLVACGLEFHEVEYQECCNGSQYDIDVRYNEESFDNYGLNIAVVLLKKYLTDEQIEEVNSKLIKRGLKCI